MSGRGHSFELHRCRDHILSCSNFEYGDTPPKETRLSARERRSSPATWTLDQIQKHHCPTALCSHEGGGTTAKDRLLRWAGSFPSVEGSDARGLGLVSDFSGGTAKVVAGDAFSVGETSPDPDVEAPFEGAAEGFPDIELLETAISLTGDCAGMINGLTGPPVHFSP